MSLVIESGSGSATAESYISVEDASAYFNNRGVTTWDALDEGEATAAREQALRKATDYIDSHYQWEGSRVYPLVQALDWPRYGVWAKEEYVDDDEIPEPLKRACAELALKSASDDLLADQTQGVVKEKVGVIEVEYNPNSPAATRYKSIDALLRPYLNSVAGCCVEMVRA